MQNDVGAQFDTRSLKGFFFSSENLILKRWAYNGISDITLI